MKQDSQGYVTGYEPLSWRSEESASSDDVVLGGLSQFDAGNQEARERSRLLHLLGSINYKIVKGNKVYVEVGGTVYKTLWGLYWRSVYTGIQHFLLRCEAMPDPLWGEDTSRGIVDLPIAYSREGWTASGQSLSFLLNRDNC